MVLASIVDIQTGLVKTRWSNVQSALGQLGKAVIRARDLSQDNGHITLSWPGRLFFQ